VKWLWHGETHEYALGRSRCINYLCKMFNRQTAQKTWMLAIQRTNLNLQVDDGDLLQGPLAVLGAVTGINEALSVRLIHVGIAGAIVATGPAALFTKQKAVRVALGNPHAVGVFQGAQRFVHVGGGQLFGVFLEHAGQLEASFKQLLAGGEPHRLAAKIFVHDLP